ncbi:hypothetical protein DL96DRAFT_1557273 [Flagelloscypha sp. PMI_526]|nr:hypothetical protein DL96DRAFT_1557273 [Flagelloscypha sp. PMI_526]
MTSTLRVGGAALHHPSSQAKLGGESAIMASVSGGGQRIEGWTARGMVYSDAALRSGRTTMCERSAVFLRGWAAKIQMEPWSSLGRAWNLGKPSKRMVIVKPRLLVVT